MLSEDKHSSLLQKEYIVPKSVTSSYFKANTLAYRKSKSHEKCVTLCYLTTNTLAYYTLQ
jgi:hypothetical protein